MSRILPWLAALACTLAACGADDTAVALDDADAAQDADLTASSWQDALPEGTQDIVMVDEVRVSGCRVAIGTAMQNPPLPPSYHAILERTPLSPRARWCRHGYVVLASSYGRPSVAIAAHPRMPIVVADFSVRATPSGSAHVHLGIAAVSALTGAVQHTGWLAAMSPDAMSPQLGNVYDGALELDCRGTLTVRGSKNGIIPGEVGAGDHYVAVFRRFTSSPDSTVMPSSIAAVTLTDGD